MSGNASYEANLNVANKLVSAMSGGRVPDMATYSARRKELAGTAPQPQPTMPQPAPASTAPVGPMPGLQPYSAVPAWAYALNQQAMAPLYTAPQAGPAMNPAMLQQGNYASFLRNFLGG